ncbi:MAG: B12-binding domain-containing radical SAM protein [Candidatus Helarchaeota archaeon]|nr:B12-binding domain-containing radical SAM protein [Candidatus Helarchaeota archaeon]
MKVRLIFPCPSTAALDRLYTDSFLSRIIWPILGWGKSVVTPPLSLLMLAAVTPTGIDIQLIDERFEDIDFNEKVDLVGITVMTRTASRAYQIADEHRKRGTKVVLGGIHPSVLPHEASLHADAVVIGEGEIIWPQLLDDHKRGRLKQFYRGGHVADLNELPFPRYDIITHPERYSTVKVITASRGCENSCTFCAAFLAVGKRYRTRNVNSVVAELRTTPGKFVIFVDDNLGWDIAYAKELCNALIPLKIKWSAELTLSALEDVELVDLMAKSGCIVLELGFESLSPKVIASIKKQQTNDPGRYRELIRRSHSRGISIIGSFIFGFDEDDLSVFRELNNFIKETCIGMPHLNALLPLPGSPIYRRFERESRLLHKNWEYYEQIPRQAVYQPKQMTPQELFNEYLSILKEIHKTGSFLKRIIGAKTLFTFGTLVTIQYNLQKQSAIKRIIAEKNQYKIIQTMDS